MLVFAASRAARLDAACRRGNDIGARSYGSIASILKHGLDGVYPRETQEMVFDAHDRAFAFFRGAPGAASTTIYGRLPPRKVVCWVGLDARIYPACCWSDRAPGLDGSPLLLAS